MRIWLLLVLCVTAGMLPAQEAELSPPEVKSILKKMADAVDPSHKLPGAAAITLRLEHVIDGGKVKSRMTVCFAGADKYLADSMLGPLPLESRGCNGRVFWRKNAAGMVERAGETETAAMRFLTRFMRPGAPLEQLFVKIAWDRKKYRLNNFECARLVCHPPPELKLPPCLIYVDRHDWLVRRAEITAPEFGRRMKVITDFHRYGSCQGVNLPIEYISYFPGAAVRSKTTGLELNVAPRADAFDLPPSGF